MTALEPLDKDKSDRMFYVADLKRLGDWPTQMHLTSRHFVLFLACDAAKIDEDALSRFAETALDQGLAYVCAWGSGCESVHDTFDWAHVMRKLDMPDDEGVVMTTWHEKDSIEEALRFFFDLAYPDKAYAPDCKDWVAVSIGSKANAKAMRRLLKLWLKQDASR